MRSGVARLCLVLAFVAAASTGVGPPPASAQQTCDGVWVVVDAREAGGPLTARCAPGDPSSGIRALEAAGHAYRYLPSQPGFVCTIDASPAACNGGPADAHWSYWTAPAGGSWSYSGAGAAARDPEPGTVEGWRFGDGSAPPGMAPPAPVPEPSTEPGADADVTAPDDAPDEPRADDPADDPADDLADDPEGDPTDPVDEPDTPDPAAAFVPDGGADGPADERAEDAGGASPDGTTASDVDRRDAERSRLEASEANPNSRSDTDADGADARAQDATSADSPGTALAGSTATDAGTGAVDALPATAATRSGFPLGLLGAVLLIVTIVASTAVTARRRSEDVG